MRGPKKNTAHGQVKLKNKRRKIIMENNGSTKVYVVAALLLGFIGGGYLGFMRGSSTGYEEARVEIKTRLEDNRYVEPVAKDVRVISGTIQAIGDNQLTLESRLPFDPTLPEGEQNRTITRTVLITPKTEITVRVMEENKQPPKPGEPFRPFLFKNVKLDLKELKTSDAVTVEAGENIADKESFEAVSIFKNS